MDTNTSWLWWTTSPDMLKLMQQGASQVKQLQTCFTTTLFYALGFHQRSTMTRVASLKMNSSIVSKNYPMSSTHEQHPTTHKVTGKPNDSTEPFCQCFTSYQKPTSLIGETICPSKSMLIIVPDMRPLVSPPLHFSLEDLLVSQLICSLE